MELWLDSTDEQIITDAANFGILTGVTTNPSILSKAQSDPETVLRRLLDMQPGYVAVQVTAENLAGMIKQAEALSKLSSDNRVIVKIPACREGFKAMAHVKRQGILTLATAVFETKQLILSALAGTDYIAPYFNRIQNSTGNALAVLKEMQETIVAQNFSIKILAAAIHSSQHLIDCARIGIPAVTVPAKIYSDLFACSADVEKSLDQFKENWLHNNATASARLFAY